MKTFSSQNVINNFETLFFITIFLRFHTDARWKRAHFWLGKITLHGSWFICLSRWQMAKHKHKKREPWSSNENACHNEETTKCTFLLLPGKLLLLSECKKNKHKSCAFNTLWLICARGLIILENFKCCFYWVATNYKISLHLLLWVICY